MQPDLLQVHHLEGNEGVVDEQRVATNHGQVGEQATDAAQPFYPKKREGEREKEREREGGGRRGREERANGSNPASRFAALRARKMAVSRKEPAGET